MRLALCLILNAVGGCGVLPLLDASGNHADDPAPSSTPTATPAPTTGLLVTASWLSAFETTGADLDLHLVKDDGVPFAAPLDCFYQNAAPEWGCVLTDSDQSPESIALESPQQATYEVLLHVYSEENEGDQNATVAIDADGSQVATHSRILSENQVWHVGRITFADSQGAPSFTTLDTISTGPTY